MGQVHQVHPALALMRSVLTGSPEKKVCQPGTNLPATQTLRSVRWSIAVVYLMKAIFAKAWAVAVVIYL
jgi:hypothetical protein